jgi:hypothetical protein
LVDEGTTVLVLLSQHLGPELRVATTHEVASLALKQRVLVADPEKRIVALCRE